MQERIPLPMLQDGPFIGHIAGPHYPYCQPNASFLQVQRNPKTASNFLRANKEGLLTCTGPGPGGWCSTPISLLPAPSSLRSEIACSLLASRWILGAMPCRRAGLNSMPAVPACLMCTCSGNQTFVMESCCQLLAATGTN